VVVFFGVCVFEVRTPDFEMAMMTKKKSKKIEKIEKKDEKPRKKIQKNTKKMSFQPEEKAMSQILELLAASRSSVQAHQTQALQVRHFWATFMHF
jgi:Skp family chaperone for outer membrane proteins